MLKANSIRYATKDEIKFSSIMAEAYTTRLQSARNIPGYPPTGLKLLTNGLKRHTLIATTKEIPTYES